MFFHVVLKKKLPAALVVENGLQEGTKSVTYDQNLTQPIMCLIWVTVLILVGK